MACEPGSSRREGASALAQLWKTGNDRGRLELREYIGGAGRDRTAE